MIWVRYAAPFTVFALTSLVQAMVGGGLAVWSYALRTFLTGAAVVLCFRGHWREIEGKPGPMAVMIGLLAAVLWVPLVRVSASQTPAVFQGWFFVSVKLLGACVVAPLAEEIFFRSFLMRVLIRNDFWNVRLGTYGPLAFWGALAAFAAMHPVDEWGAAALAGLLYGAYLVRTKDLTGCVVAHATTNLALAAYVILSARWELWS